MPELPEVETIRRGLKKYILNQKICKIKVLCEKSFIGVAPKGAIQDIRRFGKALVIDLDSGCSLMIHLRMTGQLIYDGKERYAGGHPSDNFIDQLPNRQTRVIVELENGTLYFNDQRKFGFIKSLKTDQVENDPFIKKLGPEPWQMTKEEFYEKLQKHKNSPIKALLLDQTIICGLGNIYADEALFAAKIHPKTKAGLITKAKGNMILGVAERVMNLSIAAGGSTLKDYVKADGSRGDYLDKFALVYNKTGQVCPICGKAKIEKIRVANRGTHICPRCQVLLEDSTTTNLKQANQNDKKQRGIK